MRLCYEKIVSVPALKCERQEHVPSWVTLSLPYYDIANIARHIYCLLS